MLSPGASMVVSSAANTLNVLALPYCLPATRSATELPSSPHPSCRFIDVPNTLSESCTMGSSAPAPSTKAMP